MSVIEPSGYVYLDILYYFFLVFFGPGLLMDLLFFRSTRHRLHEAYRESGVAIQGLVTNTKITVRRTFLTRIETSRSYQIRYVYKDPASDLLILKDFVHVQSAQLRQRLFEAVLLPGRPDSGVPRFLIPNYSHTHAILWTVTPILFLAAMMLEHCHTTMATRTRTCYIGISDMVTAVVLVSLLGLAIGYFIHHSAQNSVPGKVVSRVAMSSLAGQQQPEFATRIDLDNLLDMPISMALAVIILDEEGGYHENNNDNNNFVDDGAEQLPATATATVIGEPQQPRSYQGMDVDQFPRAKAI